ERVAVFGRDEREVQSLGRAAVATVGAVASASVCAPMAGVALAQYMLTLERKTGRKTKIIEIVGHLNSFQVFIFSR
uniref:Uncharacterized protein n=1 Tax=Equus caballus TaxID=9796 RepID=A0A3Q2HT38_HORSE